MIEAPHSFSERATAASRFAKEKHITFPVLVDTMDDSTAFRWSAWPLRIFVVGRSGTVLYAGQQGPWFFRPSQAFKMTLEGIPENLRDLPGFSKESLEDCLIDLRKLAGNP